ncbi:MAG: SUMF1/EgtB/PvdO family nonheme iron enzyme, partial [Bacteriovoracia bacterium]
MKNTPRYAVSPGIPFFLSILLAGSTGASAHAQEVTQMVLVDQPGKPFLIDIFETTEEEFAAVLPAHSKGGSGGGKPARITNGQTAKDYCEAKGKRLPTEAEWMLAASNLGQNKKYSLRGDALYDEKGKLLANLTDSRVYKNSEAVWNFQTVGIDAIGTVGMTGNRPEWVIGEKGTSRCGLSYYASPNNAELEKLCKPSSDTERDGTARCVLDYTDGILVQMGERVTGELRTYVESLFDPAHGWSVRPNLVFAPLPPIKPASSGGSGYSSGSTYSGGTNYSGGSSYSSNADVPDVQILTPRQRKLEFELASTPSDGMVKLSLVFTESKGRMGHEIDLGEMKVSRGKQVFRVDLELIQKIEVDHPRQRAWLKAESGGRELKFSGSGVPVFTSGEKFDYGCDNPVLISDMHNTLDKGDACTKQ